MSYLAVTQNYVPASSVLIAKHVIVFIFFTYTIYLLISFISKFLLKRNPTDSQVTRIMILRSLSFILLVIIVVLGQLQYISRKEGVSEYRCQYYDHYDNIIYANQLSGVCPELEVITQTDELLEFNTLLSLELVGSPFALSGFGLANTRDYGEGGNVVIKSNTVITYTEDHNVLTYNSKSLATSTYIKGGVELHDFVSKHRLLTNNKQSDSFEQTVKFATKTVLESTNYRETYYDFLDKNYRTERLYTAESDYYDLSLMKEVISPNQTKITQLGGLLLHRNEIGQEFTNFVALNESDDPFDLYMYEHSYFKDTYGVHLSLGSRTGEINIHSIDYSKRIGEDYLYYSYYSGLASPHYETVWNHNVNNVLDGGKIYSTGIHNYTIEGTEYGHKVTRLRENRYPLFGDISDYEFTYLGNNEMYSYLYDYEYQISQKYTLDPYYIVKPYYPFALY